MPFTLEQVLTSFGAQYGAWARERKKGEDEDENSFILQAVSRIDIFKSSECSETLSDLTDRATPGASCSLDAVHGSQLKGLEAFQKRNYGNAAQCFTTALSFLHEEVVYWNSLTAKLYRSRALCLIRLGLHHHAVEDCNLALHYQPDSDTAQFRKAIALKNLGRQDEAIQSARSALEISRSSGRHDEGQVAARLVAELSEEMARSERKPGVPQPDHSSAPTLSLQIRQIAEEGRALVLADITGAEAGALLLAEQASVLTVCKAHRSQVRMPSSRRSKARRMNASTYLFPVQHHKRLHALWLAAVPLLLEDFTTVCRHPMSSMSAGVVLQRSASGPGYASCAWGAFLWGPLAGSVARAPGVSHKACCNGTGMHSTTLFHVLIHSAWYS